MPLVGTTKRFAIRILRNVLERFSLKIVSIFPVFCFYCIGEYRSWCRKCHQKCRSRDMFDKVHSNRSKWERFHFHILIYFAAGKERAANCPQKGGDEMLISVLITRISPNKKPQKSGFLFMLLLLEANRKSCTSSNTTGCISRHAKADVYFFVDSVIRSSEIAPWSRYAPIAMPKPITLLRKGIEAIAIALAEPAFALLSLRSTVFFKVELLVCVAISWSQGLSVTINPWLALSIDKEISPWVDDRFTGIRMTVCTYKSLSIASNSGCAFSCN